MNFNEFNVHPDVMTGIETMGFEKPSPVQEQAIPVILEGRDLIACAQTGTGKTAAFLIPVIHAIAENPTGKTSTLIIVPTRELTVQIDQQLQGLGYFASIGSKPVYGGGDGSGWELEKAALTRGTDVIIATPGKLLQHLVMGYVKLDGLKHLILDEADRMLDMGFFEDIMRIIDFLPPKRQNLLFSATMPPKIREMARKILHQPTEINLAVSKPAEGVLQAAYLVHDQHKIQLIRSLLENKKLQSVLIFAATKLAVKELGKALKQSSTLRVEVMHSDLEQPQREETLNGFRNRYFEVLVATDILSRGIDIEKIDLVINYNVPMDAEDYVHRVGRTARADETGLAITMVNQKETEAFRRIERFIGSEIYKMRLPADIPTGPDYSSTSPRGRRPGNTRYTGRSKQK
ncbi:MAG: DEAD/DEAH box helicase [Bacteroidales bacterium]